MIYYNHRKGEQKKINSGRGRGKVEIMKKIDKAIERKMMETGAMGTEAVTVKINLTGEEKEEFLNCEKYDTDNYSWEFDGEELIISYTEEVEA